MKNLPTTAAEVAAMDKRELANACLDAIAENARLREALGKIAENATTPGYLLEQRRHAIWQMARAALEAKP
jgi:hypothetical protein